MSDSIERIIADLRRWGVDGAEEIADRLAALPAVAAPIATEQPSQRTSDAIAKGDGLREAVRSVLASIYATSPSQLDEYNIHVEGWIETLQRALDTSERKDGSNG